MPNKIIIGILILLALAVSILAHFEPRFPGDLRATLLFQSIHSAPLLAAMEGISYAVSGWRTVILVAVSSAVVWRWLGRLEGGFVLLSGLTSAINGAFKIVINRPRPAADLVSVFEAKMDGSFPSGHAFFAILFLGMLAYLLVTHQTRPILKKLSIIIALFLILWIGASRVYLGAHWTSDVIGGYLVGASLLAGEIWLYQMLCQHSGGARAYG